MRALKTPNPVRISLGDALEAHSYFATRGDHGLLVVHIIVKITKEASGRVYISINLLLLLINKRADILIVVQLLLI